MSMLTAVSSAWALLLGLAVIMLGNGLQGTLLGVRASLEGFSTQMTGVIMTGYFSGFLLGSLVVPRLLKNVGHIRVFAALASVLSAAVLLHSILVDPIVWTAIRVTSGFAVAGLYVVVESWLNDAATNRTRGQLLSVYMVIVLGGMAAGQFLLNLADPGGFELFILISVLVSVSLVPISLSVSPAPRFEAPKHVSLRALYGISPLGLIGCLVVGVAHSTLISMGAIYGRDIGMSVPEISVFMATMLIGGVMLQFPIGRASDVLDRRVVLIVVTLLAGMCALAAGLVGPRSQVALLVLIFFFGGLSYSVYSLCIAYANDHLQPEEMVAASASLILTAGIGLTVGPVLCAQLMELFGPAGYFWTLVAAHVVIGVFGLYRMTRSDTIPREAQTAYVALPRTSQVAATISSAAIRDHRDRDLARWSRM